jgi:hypothetical protein
LYFQNPYVTPNARDISCVVVSSEDEMLFEEGNEVEV